MENQVTTPKKKKTLMEWLKSREGQKLLVIVTFMFVPLLLLVVFTYVPFLKMVEFSFYKMKYVSTTCLQNWNLLCIRWGRG